jgi:hypothetical protein
MPQILDGQYCFSREDIETLQFKIHEAGILDKLPTLHAFSKLCAESKVPMNHAALIRTAHNTWTLVETPIPHLTPELPMLIHNAMAMKRVGLFPLVSLGDRTEGLTKEQYEARRDQLREASAARNKYIANGITLDGGMLDTLIALVERGPLEDGDIPSKVGRTDLIELGLVSKAVVGGEEGYQVATYAGSSWYRSYFGGDTIKEAMEKRKAKRTAAKPKMITYSLRAECPADVARLILALTQKRLFVVGAQMTSPFTQDGGHTGEALFEFLTACTLDELRVVIRTLEDSHVMLQTLRALPLSSNKFERDYTLV